MLLGLTGGYCAGKNTIAAILEELGWTCIDVDKLGHAAIELERDRIVERFGSGVLGDDGRIDRGALGKLVFASPEALADQEAIIHPVAIRLLDERIASACSAAETAGREALVCINAALLFKAPQAGTCDAIIEVRAPLMLRVSRAKARDGLGTGAILRRMWSQRSLMAGRRKAGRPVVVLWNDGGGTELRRAVERTLAKARAAARIRSRREQV